MSYGQSFFGLASPSVVVYALSVWAIFAVGGFKKFTFPNHMVLITE